MKTTITKLAAKHEIIDQVIRSAPSLPREADPFPVVEMSLSDSLPIHALKAGLSGAPSDERQIRRENRLKMVAAFTASVTALQQKVADLNRMLGGIIESQVRPLEPATRESHALRGEKVGAMFAKFKRPHLEVLDVLHAELMARPDHEVFETLKTALFVMSCDVVRQLQTMLTTLQKEQSAGSIVWLDRDVCKYHYFEHRRGSRTTTGKSRREERIRQGNQWVTYEIVSRTSNLEKYDVTTRIEHHLFCAARHQFPATQLRWPKHLAPLRECIPAWLAPHVFVTEGDMLRETFRDDTTHVSTTPVSSQVVGVNEIGREEIWTGVSMSPAVSIGSIVFGGWSKHDL